MKDALRVKLLYNNGNMKVVSFTNEALAKAFIAANVDKTLEAKILGF